MQVNALNELDLETEITEKRLSPEFLYDYLENNFREITRKYSARRSVYRSKVKASEAHLKKTISYFDTGLAAAAESSEIIKEALRNFDNPRYFELLAQANDPLQAFEEIDFDSNKWSRENRENFDQLHLEWSELKHQADRANKALLILIKGKALTTIFSALVFSLSFVISYYLGTYLEGLFSFTGEFWAKLLTAFLFFLVVDRILDTIKSKLIWSRIEILYLGMQKLTAINALQQDIVNSNTTI